MLFRSKRSSALRLLFVVFPTDIALDRVHVVFTESRAKYYFLHTIIITKKQWCLIFLLSQWCVLLPGEPGRGVMSATETKNGDWNRAVAGLTGTATARYVVLCWCYPSLHSKYSSSV